jgi:multisubunit Na+/H+ antiporter MnhG subunit
MLDHVLIAVALVAGCVVAAASALGLSLAKTAYDRIHFIGPPGASALLFAIAIWLDAGPSLIAVKATLLAAILVGGSPVMTHVMSRVARTSEHGDWRWREADGEVEGS